MKVYRRHLFGLDRWTVFREDGLPLGVYTEHKGFEPNKDQFMMHSIEAPKDLRRMPEWVYVRILIQNQAALVVDDAYFEERKAHDENKEADL